MKPRFTIRYGWPQIHKIMEVLEKKFQAGKLSKDERKRLKLYVKCFNQLSFDPQYPGLKSHEISKLSQKYGIKVWQSYLKNNSPAAGRVFWIYGPNKKDITICAIEPHPDPDKYGKVKLSTAPVG